MNYEYERNVAPLDIGLHTCYMLKFNHVKIFVCLPTYGLPWAYLCNIGAVICKFLFLIR